MEAFYAFASLDYELLAGVLDWKDAVGATHARRGLAAGAALTLLDVACGSGKFPAALLRADALPASVPITCDLLDPSAFSISEAARELKAPLTEGAGFETTLEGLDPAAGPWDVVWATHALYALHPDQLDAAARRFVDALAPGGFAFLAQGAHAGHYLSVYRAFIEGVRPGATPYLSGEQVADALIAAAADRDDLEASTRHLHYEHRVPFGEDALLEGYLQRCLFDDTLALDAILAAPVLGSYVASCRDETDGAHRFAQDVLCLTLAPQGATPSWTAGS